MHSKPLQNLARANPAAPKPVRQRWLPVLWLVVVTAGSARADELVAPYVQTVMEDVELMLETAAVGPGDYLIDLGSGDGRIVMSAASYGALAHGVELDRELVDLARARAREAGLDDRVAFVHGDVFDADLSGATVVTLYLMPEANLRLRPRLLAELEPGTRVVSNSFDMGDWLPERHVFGRTSGGVHLWVVPARVAGRWQVTLPDGAFELAIAQRFQDLELTAHGTMRFSDPLLEGRRIRFLAEDSERRYAFSGSVRGDVMNGIVQVQEAGATQPMQWRGQRVRPADPS